jgi:hypothetical protein
MASRNTESDALFRRVDTGWVFRAPNPLIFGDAQHYLVNDDQKASISKIITPRRPILLGVSVGLILMAWVLIVSAFAWMIGLDAAKASRGQTTAMILLSLLPALVALPIIGKIQLLRLAPILAEAEPSRERITLREVSRVLNSSYGTKRATLLGLMWAFSAMMQAVTLAIRNDRHPLLSDVQSYLNVFGFVLAVFIAGRFFWMACKAWSKSADHT